MRATTPAYPTCQDHNPPGAYGRCGYCKIPLRLKPNPDGTKSPDDATIEHILPRASGGHSYWDNLVIACRKCNDVKGAMMPDDFRALLAQDHDNPTLSRANKEER